MTRTLTATRPGTYEVSASIPGVDVTVSPSTLTFAAAGDTQRFTVAFANATAPVEVWATGFLTWTGEDGTSVRSPLAVRPATVDATALVTGEGVDGSARVPFVAGMTGELALDVDRPRARRTARRPDDPAPGHSGDGISGDANGNVAWVVEVPEGSPLAEFALSASDGQRPRARRCTASPSPTARGTTERWTSATPSAPEQRVVLVDPDAGSYLVVAAVGDVADDETWDLRHAVVGARATTPLSVAPLSVTAVAGGDARYTLSWTVAAARHRVRRRRRVRRLGGPHRRADRLGCAGPGRRGRPGHHRRLRGRRAAHGDTGHLVGRKTCRSTYQWLRDGEPISGAAAQDYRVREADVGTTLSAQVTATLRGNVNPGIAVSDGVLVNAASARRGDDEPLRGHVGSAVRRHRRRARPRAASPATGTVSVRSSGAEFVGTLADGTGDVRAAGAGARHPCRRRRVRRGPKASTRSSGISGFAVRD